MAGTFVKAHAYGNDFLILDADALPPADADLPQLARRVCDRHRGIGGDGLLVASRIAGRVRMRLLNADGSDSEISGNGLRCLAALLARQSRMMPGASLTIETDAGSKRLDLIRIDGARYTFVAHMGVPTDLRQVTLALEESVVEAVVLRVGNPQCVVLGPATDERLRAIAAGLAVHPFFPEGTNVELADVRGPRDIRILIWERGVGPTESSGTGTCAAAVAAAAYGGAERSVEVTAPGGTQRVEWTAEGLLLTGWAELVASVEWWGT